MECSMRQDGKVKKNLELLYWLIPLGFTLLFNNTVYIGSRLLMSNRYHHDITSSLDQKIPFLPEFILVYFGCYLFWAVNYYIIARQNAEIRSRFLLADFYAKIVCFICFILFPTTNMRPVLSGDGIWVSLVRLLYQVDAADNLFPSIHCLVSWLSYIGLRSVKGVPRWYRLASLVMAVLVCVSTVVLKQHVLIDVAAGVVLAEAVYFISWHTKGYHTYMRIFETLGDRINAYLGGRRRE